MALQQGITYYNSIVELSERVEKHPLIGREKIGIEIKQTFVHFHFLFILNIIKFRDVTSHTECSSFMVNYRVIST